METGRRPLLFVAVLMLLLIKIQDAPAVLDPESLDCLSCHDGSVAVDIMVSGCPACNHPLGVDYAYMAAGNPGLMPLLSLDPSVKLIDDEIGCATCHVPYSPANHLDLAEKRKQYPLIPDPMLVMDNRISQLCLACHRK